MDKLATRPKLSKSLGEAGGDPLPMAVRQDVGEGLPSQVATMGRVTDNVFHLTPGVSDFWIPLVIVFIVADELVKHGPPEGSPVKL